MAPVGIVSATALLARIAAARFLLSAARLELLLKANFNPNQPRVPPGNSDGGQWSGSGGGGTPASHTPGPRGSSFRSPSIGGHRITDRGTHVQLGDDGPLIPKQQPQSIRQANRIGVGVAQWLLRTAVRASPIGRVADLISVAGWLYEHREDIQAYLQGPKTLDELRTEAQSPRSRYERHHVVEQTSARQDGYSEAMIHAPENLMLIPRYRHWEVTGWYQIPNKDFGRMTPRDYLRDTDWWFRESVGHDALRRFDMLRPR
jgi:hypothetical protein